MKTNSFIYFIFRSIFGSLIGHFLGVGLFYWYGDSLDMKIVVLIVLLPFIIFIGFLIGTIIWLVKSKFKYSLRTILCTLTGSVIIAAITFAYAYWSY